MPITAITSQPPANTLHAAYRPIVFQVTATPTTGTGQPPVVYCDIYFGGTYYKSVSKTLPLSSGVWQFDIQDAAQEYLRRYLPPNGGNAIYQGTPSMTKVSCKFRSSGTNTNGFLVPEGLEPKQATGQNPATGGTGTSSNSFFVVNSTLQHEDNQDLSAHLNSLKSGTWSAQAFPLTRRPQRYFIPAGSSDFFTLAYIGESPVKCIKVYYRNRGQNTYQSASKCFDNPCPVMEPFLSFEPSGETNQKVVLSWNTLPYYVTGVKFEYRPVGSTADFTVTFYSPSDGELNNILIIPRGRYDLFMTAIGNCQGGRTWQLLNFGLL
jgi:hypothetical protein